MEEKLRYILDHLNQEETDKLLEGLKGPQCSLDQANIEKLVLNGIHKKKRVLSWKIYSVAGVVAAACLFIIVGLFQLNGSGTGFTRLPKNPDQVAEKQPDSTEEPSDYVRDPVKRDEMYVEAGSEDDKEEDHSSDKKNNSKPNHGSNSSKDNNAEVYVGGNRDGEYVSLSSDEINNLFELWTDEIDLSNEGVKYTSVDEMSEEADYVIKAQVLSSNLIYLNDDRYQLVANVEVIEKIDGSDTDELPETIKVKEGILLDFGSEVFTHVDGYSRMQEGKEYYLFLKKGNDKVYDILGTVYGKVSLDENETDLCLDGDHMLTEEIQILRILSKNTRNQYESSPIPQQTTEPLQDDNGDQEIDDTVDDLDE